MNEKNRNLVIRIASAVLMLPIALGLLWLGGIATILLAAAASAIVASELYKMAGLSLRHPAAIIGLLSTASLAWLGASLESRWPGVVGVMALAPLASLTLYTLLPPKGDLRQAATSAAFAALATPYVGVGLGAVVALRSLPGTMGFTWTLVALGVTWGNDTGAYFAGRLLGRHKLYPRISPNKTWEGFFGGMATSVLICFLIRWIYDPGLGAGDCAIVGVVGAILGPLGDLSESMMKRAFGVKDSGRIMPGHGGIYDRVDALLFVAPWVFAYQHFIRVAV